MALSIENIDEQFITLGTEDYDLVIDIGGNPDDVLPQWTLWKDLLRITGTRQTDSCISNQTK